LVVVVVVVVFEADDAASSFAVTSHMALRINLIILDESIYCEANENGTVQATSESTGFNESSQQCSTQCHVAKRTFAIQSSDSV
jgi:hypothetical protein